MLEQRLLEPKIWTEIFFRQIVFCRLDLYNSPSVDDSRFSSHLTNRTRCQYLPLCLIGVLSLEEGWSLQRGNY